MSLISKIQDAGLDLADQNTGVELAGDVQGFAEKSILEVMINDWYINGPLLILSVLAVYIFIERTMAVNRALSEEKNFMEKIKDYINDSKLDSARNLCASTMTPVARMLEKGIARIGKPMDEIKASIDNVGKLEIYRLEKNVSLMATIAGAAPMIGFLGTVIGMVDVFTKIRLEGNTIDSLAGGMMTALITTIFGLIVGVLAFFGYNFLVSRVSKVVHKMEGDSIEFFDILEQPGK